MAFAVKHHTGANLLRAAAFIAMPALFFSTSIAEPITFVFEGQVETVFDGLGALDGQVQPGTKFTGSYTFDSETPNTAEPIDEGQLGLYEHDQPPAGVRIVVGSFAFESVASDIDFDIHVANDFGFAGTDEYGFISHNNEMHPPPPAPPLGRLDLHWLAQNFEGQPFTSAELPLTPPDLDVLGGGLLTIYGECTVCAGPAAFFRIEGTLTSLELPLDLEVDRDALSWNGPVARTTYDIVRGDLGALRESLGDFAFAIDECLANDHEGTSFPYLIDPGPAEGFWFLMRGATYDSVGLGQSGRRDAPIAQSGIDCP